MLFAIPPEYIFANAGKVAVAVELFVVVIERPVQSVHLTRTETIDTNPHGRQFLWKFVGGFSVVGHNALISSFSFKPNFRVFYA